MNNQDETKNWRMQLKVWLDESAISSFRVIALPRLINLRRQPGRMMA